MVCGKTELRIRKIKTLDERPGIHMEDLKSELISDKSSERGRMM